MKIPFTKAHGARNDFLLTWRREAPERDLDRLARAICDRHTGVGADGWILVEPDVIRLLNSDGSEAEISGNGTRCAAAFLIHNGFAESEVRLLTGAGLKRLRLLRRSGLKFLFEMEMGGVEITNDRFPLPLAGGARDVTIAWAGNPQCAVPVEDFAFDWRTIGAEIESHGHFPKRTNVSFFRALDLHTLEVRFWERGAGETMSSGTGSTGAVAAAMARGFVSSPVEVRTPAGPLHVSYAEGIFSLSGPAEIIAEGQFLMG